MKNLNVYEIQAVSGASGEFSISGSATNTGWKVEAKFTWKF